MQAATTAAGQAVGLDHRFDARQVLRERPAIGCALFGRAARRSILGIVCGAGRGDCCFQIFQRQLKLIGIALFRPPPKSRMLEGRDWLFQAFDPLVLAKVARISGDQHRLQRSNFIKQINGIWQAR